MPLFQDLSYARPQNVYAGSPVDEVKALNADASKQYSEARDAKDSLDILYNNLPVEDRNIDIKKRAIDGLRERFKSLIASGNYQDANYVVKQAQKDYLMNNELQDAIKSKQAQDQYHTELQDRLKKGLAGEKGGITEDQYNYAVTKSALQNQTPLQYDPTKRRSYNMFRGINVSDDLSQEISNKTFDRIKDWKDNGIATVNGQTYKIENIGGVERVMLNGKEVPYEEVANALKQDILNNGAYKKYLDESRDIHKFNNTFNYQTGQQRDINRDDLKSLTDPELKQMYLGVTDKQVDDLRKSKDLVSKATLEAIQNKEKNFDINNPKVLNDLYDQVQAKDQLNNVVYPAAEKASFKNFEQKIFTDQGALENLKFEHAKKLKKYEEDLKNTNQPPLVHSLSQANLFTGDDYNKKLESIKNLQGEVQKAKSLLTQTDPNSSLYRTRIDDYNNALGQLNIANSDVNTFYTALPPEARGKIVGKVSEMFNTIPSALNNRDTQISREALDSLIQEAKVNKDTQLQSQLMTAKMYMQEGKQLPEQFVSGLSNAIVNNEKYLKIAAAEDDKITDRGHIVPGYESGFPGNTESGSLVDFATGVNRPIRSIGNALVPFSGNRTSINNVITEAYNDKALDQSLKLTSLPDLGIKENTPLTNSFYGYARNVINNASDLYTTDGSPLDAVLAGRTDKKFYKLDDKGKYIETLPDLDRTAISIASGAKDGVKRLSTTYYDKEGKPLVLSDGTPSGDKGARSAVIIAARDPETLTPLFNIAAQHAELAGDKDQSNSLQGEVNFGHILNKARLGTTVDPFEVTFPDGNSRIIAFKKDSEDASTIIDMTKTINGLPNQNFGRPLFGTNHSTFRSNEELVKAFQRSMTR